MMDLSPLPTDGMIRWDGNGDGDGDGRDRGAMWQFRLMMTGD